MEIGNFALGRHRSTIRRECQRNAMSDGRYESGPAQTRAHSRRRAHLRRPKTGHARLMAYVGQRLTDRWSPEQIAGRLAHRPPADLEDHSISHTMASPPAGVESPANGPSTTARR